MIFEEKKYLTSHYLSLDTETTGLKPFQQDRLFAIIISTDIHDDYFSFISYPEEGILADSPKIISQIKSLAANTELIWFMQNAKFDLHFLAKEGVYVLGKIYDLQFLERIFFNQHQSYSLAEISKRWGEAKLDIVMKYVTEHKLKTKVVHEEFKKEEELLHFERVPYSIIKPYGEQDGRATRKLGERILTAIREADKQLLPGVPKQMAVVENEARLVHTLFRMEQVGIQLDRDYCKTALDHYFAKLKLIEFDFKQITGLDFVKGTTVFEEVFKGEKDKWEKTDKGNWRWDSEVLSGLEHPAAGLASEYAEAKKQSEYFANFLFYADRFGVLHPEFKQAGTVTGRLSSANPNIQNLTSPDKYDTETEPTIYPVRKAFVPRPGYFFAMLDYAQMEFRILLDLAKANSLINEVLKGHDVHTATANISGTTRKEAKTNNFLTAYGGGVVKLAGNLYKTKGTKNQLGAIYKGMFNWRMSVDEHMALPTITKELWDYNEPLIRKAYDIQQTIFRSAPEIKDLLKTVQRVAENRGYVFNWLGRRYQFPDKRWCYKAPNHIIQGGAADVTKIAMNQTDELLLGKGSRLILSIHDELILEVKYGEEHVVDEVKRIMETVYPYKRLPLLVDVEYSYTNLADKQSWPPPHLKSGAETGDVIQKEATHQA